MMRVEVLSFVRVEMTRFEAEQLVDYVGLMGTHELGNPGAAADLLKMRLKLALGSEPSDA